MSATVFSLNVFQNAEPEVVWMRGKLHSRGELLRALEAPAISSDKDLVAAAYRKYGTACPSHLLGDFSFVIRNPATRSFFAARDTSGAVPFYYHVGASNFAVADLLSDLLDASNERHELDQSFAINSICAANYEFEQSAYRNYLKLRPGHSLNVGADRVTSCAYWHPDQISEVRRESSEEYAETFLGILDQAVSDRLPEGGKVGVHVTGGLDSACTTALTCQKAEVAPTGLAWQPPPTPETSAANEYECIDALCGQEGLTPIYCPPTADDIVDVLLRDATRVPTAFSLFNEWPVQRAAAERGVTAILSGFGGDQFASHNGAGYCRSLALSGRWGELAALGANLGHSQWKFVIRQLFDAIHSLLPPSLFEKYGSNQALGLSESASLARTFLPPNSKALLTEEHQQLLTARQPYLHPDLADQIGTHPRRRKSPVTSVRDSQINSYNRGILFDRIESWADSGARHGITYHYPLLDRRVMEFALSVPGQEFTNGQFSRLLFRRTLEPIVPATICWNRTKDDPQRANAMNESLRKGLAMIGSDLRTRTTLPSRSHFLDMPRLLRDLEADSLADRFKFGKLLLALRFLDF